MNGSAPSLPFADDPRPHRVVQFRKVVGWLPLIASSSNLSCQVGERLDSIIGVEIAFTQALCLVIRFATRSPIDATESLRRRCERCRHPSSDASGESRADDLAEPTLRVARSIGRHRARGTSQLLQDVRRRKMREKASLLRSDWNTSHRPLRMQNVNCPSLGLKPPDLRHAQSSPRDQRRVGRMAHLDLDRKVRRWLTSRSISSGPRISTAWSRKVERLVSLQPGVHLLATIRCLSGVLPGYSEASSDRLDEFPQSFRKPIVPARFSHENQPPVAIDHPHARLIVKRVADLHVRVPGDAPHHEALFAVLGLGGGGVQVASPTWRHLIWLSWRDRRRRADPRATSGPKYRRLTKGSLPVLWNKTPRRPLGGHEDFVLGHLAKADEVRAVDAPASRSSRCPERRSGRRPRILDRDGSARLDRQLAGAEELLGVDAAVDNPLVDVARRWPPTG